MERFAKLLGQLEGEERTRAGVQTKPRLVFESSPGESVLSETLESLGQTPVTKPL